VPADAEPATTLPLPPELLVPLTTVTDPPTLPATAAVAAPAVTVTDPPASADDAPARTATAPPTPESPPPAVTLTAPPRPPDACPLCTDTHPELPACVVPLLSSSEPLTPVVPALDDAIVTPPLDDAPPPLTIITDPPVAPEEIPADKWMCAPRELTPPDCPARMLTAPARPAPPAVVPVLSTKLPELPCEVEPVCTPIAPLFANNDAGLDIMDTEPE
jgi:hypothetical protein